MPGHKDLKGHIEFIDGKAVLVIDEEVKKEVVVEIKEELDLKSFKKNKKEK